MALPEETFGPSLDGSSKYLDTSESEWPDATSGEGPLYAGQFKESPVLRVR